MTKKPYSCVPDTLKHMKNVRYAIGLLRKKLVYRGKIHDRSKVEDPELEYFNKYTPMLAKIEYGSKEYQESIDNLKPALEHHYANNSHHPEHYPNGIADMDIIDLLEMFCDWNAASKRTKDGTMQKSIDVSCKRFNVDGLLKKIFENSVDIFEERRNNTEENGIETCPNCTEMGCVICPTEDK